MTHAVAPSVSLYSPEVRGQRFEAGVTAAELNDSNQPGPKWSARSVRISSSHVVISSKRMSYTGRNIFLAIHKVDSRPMVLAGCVESCCYVANGFYCIVVGLRGIPDGEVADAWSDSFLPRNTK
jgi:hypothetical protein